MCLFVMYSARLFVVYHVFCFVCRIFCSCIRLFGMYSALFAVYSARAFVCLSFILLLHLHVYFHVFCSFLTLYYSQEFRSCFCLLCNLFIYNLRIIFKPHAHVQTMTERLVMFRKDRYKVVGRVAHTRYITQTRLCDVLQFFTAVT